MKGAPRPDGPEGLPRLLDAATVAGWLGITERGARALLARGELPSFRLGARVYVRAADVEAAIAAKIEAAARARDRSHAAGRVLAGLPARPRNRRRVD